MQHEYSDNMVTPYVGMKEMKILIDKTGMRTKSIFKLFFTLFFLQFFLHNICRVF